MRVKCCYFGSLHVYKEQGMAETKKVEITVEKNSKIKLERQANGTYLISENNKLGDKVIDKDTVIVLKGSGGAAIAIDENKVSDGKSFLPRYEVNAPDIELSGSVRIMAGSKEKPIFRTNIGGLTSVIVNTAKDPMSPTGVKIVVTTPNNSLTGEPGADANTKFAYTSTTTKRPELIIFEKGSAGGLFQNANDKTLFDLDGKAKRDVNIKAFEKPRQAALNAGERLYKLSDAHIKALKTLNTELGLAKNADAKKAATDKYNDATKDEHAKFVEQRDRTGFPPKVGKGTVELVPIDPRQSEKYREKQGMLDKPGKAFAEVDRLKAEGALALQAPVEDRLPEGIAGKLQKRSSSQAQG